MKLIDKFFDKNYAKIWHTFFKVKQKMGLLEPPDDVQWLATSRCNLRCKHCGSDAGKRDPNELTTAEMLKVVDDLAAMGGVKYLTLTGGEPLVREDLFEILNYAASKGIEYNLVTNSTFVPKYADELTKLPPASIKVSIDGTPATHADIRGNPDNFDSCMRALTFFKQLGIGTRVICTTLNQKNFGEVEELFKYVLSSDASFWEFHDPIYEGRALENKEWMTLKNEQVEWLFKFIIDKKDIFPVFMGECGYCGNYTKQLYWGRRFFCGSGWTTFTIMHNGNVAGCPAFRDEWTEGNVRKDSVITLWHDRFERFRNLHDNLTDDCKKCKYLPACGGGCWMQRRTGHDYCFKEVWERELG